MWLRNNWLQFTLILAVVAILAGSTPLIGLTVFLFVAGMLARFWAKHVLDQVHYQRVIPESRAFAGETIAMTLRLANDKLLPMPWIEVKDMVPEGAVIEERHLSRAGSPNYVYISRSTHLSWYERVSWPLQFKSIQRGYYRLGPAYIQSGDIFGFFSAEREEETHDAVVIYPRLYTLPELGLPAERPFGEKKGRERIFEDPSRIAGLREYRPGDPMRRIDWKATARQQTLTSRVYEPSSTMHMLVAVNVHTLEHSWEGYIPEVLDRILSVAGSVARYGFESGYSVGLIANGAYPESDRPMRVPVGRSSDQLARVLEALAVIGPLTLTPLERVLDREAQSFPFGATLVCVTSRMDESLAISLRRVAEAGHAVTVLSLAEVEFEEDLGRIRVFNLDTTLRSLEAHAGSSETST